MNIKTILFLLSFFCITKIFGQITLAADTSLKISLNWKKGEAHCIKIVSNTQDNFNNISKSSSTKYIAKFNIVDKTKDGFIIKWQYTKCDLDANETNIENVVLGNLVNVIFNLSISKDGEIKELINVDDIRVNANKIIDSLIVSYDTNNQKKVLYKLIKQILSTNEGVKGALLKHYDFYNLFFGSTYILNTNQEINTILQNVFADQPCDAIAKTKLLQIDNKNSICVLEKKVTTDGEVLRKGLLEYLERNSNKIPKEAIEKLNSNDLEYSLSYLQKIDFKQSIILSSEFIRKMNLGFSNRTITISIDNAD